LLECFRYVDCPLIEVYCDILHSFLSPLPKYRWQYQGIDLRSRWFNGSKELNFEFFHIKQAGHTLGITRVTKYSGGTFRCYAYNDLGVTKKTGQLTVLCRY